MEKPPTVEHVEAQQTLQDAGHLKSGARVEAVEAENNEHQMGFWEALKTFPKASFWALVMCFTIVMESYQLVLIGSAVAEPAFAKRYGVYLGPSEGYVIPTRWQSALTQAGPIGAFVGIFIIGPVTNRIGYRWATISGLILINAFIFVMFFGNSLPVFLVGQFLEGIPWGFFIANSPGYASEIVPLSLRGAATASVMMAWVVGGLISNCVMYAYQSRADEWAYRTPFAIQWIFPAPLAILLYFAPESPWWLVRKGRLEQAEKAIRLLGGDSRQNPQHVLAMMVRTIEIERTETAHVSYKELWCGSDLRRTLICCFIYAAQNWAGNLIGNQSIFFFEQAGISSSMSFALGIIMSCLQIVGVVLCWVLGAYFGRRRLYLVGTATNAILALILGIVATVGHGQGASYGQAVLGICIVFIMGLILGPVSYTIIAETSSVRLRALTTGVGRAAYYIANVPTIYLSSQMLNPTGWNMSGKSGYVWCGTATIVFIISYFTLPEMKDRSYRELDVLFHRRVPSRKFSSTIVEAGDE